MGTNFYLNIPHPPEDDDDPSYHIGKRSAAGLYCWDCNITLCMTGNVGVHTHDPMYEQCPRCNKAPIKNDLDWGSAGVELGFNAPYTPDERKGVRTASSFTWAMSRATLIKAIDESHAHEPIIDEYDRTYTYEEFEKKVLDNCPIRFNHMIGRHFG